MGACGSADTRGDRGSRGSAAPSAAPSCEARRARCRRSRGVPGAASTRASDHVETPPASSAASAASAAGAVSPGLQTARRGARMRTGAGNQAHVRRHVAVVLHAAHSARSHLVARAREVEPALRQPGQPCASLRQRKGAACARGVAPQRCSARSPRAHLFQRLLQRKLGPAQRPGGAVSAHRMPGGGRVRATLRTHCSRVSAASSVLHSASSSSSSASTLGDAMALAAAPLPRANAPADVTAARGARGRLQPQQAAGGRAAGACIGAPRAARTLRAAAEALNVLDLSLDSPEHNAARRGSSSARLWGWKCWRPRLWLARVASAQQRAPARAPLPAQRRCRRWQRRLAMVRLTPSPARACLPLPDGTR